MSKTKNIIHFKTKAESIINNFQNLINTMPQKGNSAIECQRMFLQLALNELSYAVNGTEQKDLIEDKE